MTLIQYLLTDFKIRRMAKTQWEKDIAFIKNILPKHYIVYESSTTGSVHCKSKIGIKKPPYLNESTGKMIEDAEDEGVWQSIMFSLEGHFGEIFQEVYHNTCYCHVDFTVYLKK